MRIKIMIVGLLILLAHGVWAEEADTPDPKATADSAAAAPAVADSSVAEYGVEAGGAVDGQGAGFRGGASYYGGWCAREGGGG